MGTLAFFPWLPGQDLVENSAFALLPFEPNKSPCKPGSVEQDHIDRVLGAYHTSAVAPLKTGTVLKLPNHGITDDLDDEDVAEIFVLSEVIAVSALAIREFFQNNYFNRDNYKLVVQNFQPDRRLLLFKPMTLKL